MILQIDRVVKRALSMLTLINQGIEYRSCNIIFTIVQDIGEASLGVLLFNFGHAAIGKMP